MTETTTLAHISDVHLGPLAGFHPRYWNLKRGLGYLNWHRGRVHVHLRDVANAIAADAVAQKPDHIVVTGDLANIGLPSEYDAALSWLEALGDPRHVSVVPGNHDIYTTRLHSASCLTRWAPFMTSDAWGSGHAADGGDGFPFVRRVGGIALVGLNSAVPTPPFVASGRLGKLQLDAFARTLETLGDAGVIRVVLIHHPPLPGQAARMRGLEDADEFERVIDQHGAELVLHGHNHRDMLAWRRWSRGHVPVIGVASGSVGQAHKNEPLARYNLYKLTRQDGEVAIEVRTRGLADVTGPIVELSHARIEPHARSHSHTA
jgi:3',5'-cyclic AMP phosphodiesterase CpdA